MSEDTAQLSYIAAESISARNTGEKSFSVFLSEERDVVGSAALLVNTDLRLMPRLTIQAGPQAYVALLSEENEDVAALSLGVRARLELDRRRGLAVVGSAFYSPDILTFGAAENLSDFMARAELRLTSRLIGFGGYRWFEFDQLDRQERTLQNELFVGVQWQLE